MARRTKRLMLIVAALLAGCGEPSRREVDNARAFEALLTSITLRDAKELEKNASKIDERHTSKELSDGKYQELRKMIETARKADWDAAEKQAYDFRSQFGDKGSYFK